MLDLRDNSIVYRWAGLVLDRFSIPFLMNWPFELFDGRDAVLFPLSVTVTLDHPVYVSFCMQKRGDYLCPFLGALYPPVMQPEQQLEKMWLI